MTTTHDVSVQFSQTQLRASPHQLHACRASVSKQPLVSAAAGCEPSPCPLQTQGATPCTLCRGHTAVSSLASAFISLSLHCQSSHNSVSLNTPGLFSEHVCWEWC